METLPRFVTCEVIVGNLVIDSVDITEYCSSSTSVCSSTGLFPRLTDITGHLALTNVIFPAIWQDFTDAFPALAIIHGLSRASYHYDDKFVSDVQGASVIIQGLYEQREDRT